MVAAKAAYCAGQESPELFWEMHDWLFTNQDSWSASADPAAQLRQAAIDEGANGTRYDACVADPATQERILRDLQEGGAMGVQGTPAFFINNWFLSGAYPFADFQDRIEKAKQGLNPPPTPTPLPPGVQFFDLDPARPGLTYDGSPSQGAAEALLILVSFEDFKSAGSAEHALTVEPALQAKYVDSGELRLVFEFFPETAPKAAVAALCAAGQDRFWEFRTQLYAQQAEWAEGDNKAMAGFAKSLGLDEAAFDACLADEKAQAQIDAYYQFGQQQIGVPTTPSFLLIQLAAPGQVVDVQGLPGLQTLDALEQAIQAYLEPQISAPTPAGPISAEGLASLPVGVDADGNFYRGDPAAPVRLIDFSDFQ